MQCSCGGEMVDSAHEVKTLYGLEANFGRDISDLALPAKIEKKVCRGCGRGSETTVRDEQGAILRKRYVRAASEAEGEAEEGDHIPPALAEWVSLDPLNDAAHSQHQWLSKDFLRSLTHDGISHNGLVRQDRRGNICFAHYTEERCVSGWEVLNLQGWRFAGGAHSIFSRGGKKALFAAEIGGSDSKSGRVALATSAASAMIFGLVSARPGDILVSTGGAPSGLQVSMIKGLLSSMPESEVVLAMTQERIPGVLQGALLDCGREASVYVPPGGMGDWFVIPTQAERRPDRGLGVQRS